MLKENEERMLEMPFEVILTSITTIPIKFIIDESDDWQESLK